MTAQYNYFEIKLEEVPKGIGALKYKINKRLSPNHPDCDIRLALESEPLEENLVTKIFHKGEIYSGEEIILKLKSIRGFEVFTSKLGGSPYGDGYENLADVDKNKKYKIIDEEYSSTAKKRDIDVEFGHSSIF